jgi:acyl-CoA synthetase (AMP-forming)/AMP-acid ligase II
MRAGPDDVWLSGQPLFHIGGINGLLPFLALGATSIVTPTTGFDPEAEIVSAYGQTEMSGATTLLKGPDSTRKMGSVGLPMRDVELRVVDDAMLDVGPDQVGEIVYRGPFVMRGYWNNAEATAEAFAGGWFHSGDLATRDEEGYLRLVDRKKDMIVSGGENIYPAEVERVLREHPAVEDVAVVGFPHPRWGETPVAFVVGSADQAELIEHCRAHLASYKKPTAVRFVEALPRNAGGKVLKRELRA